MKTGWKRYATRRDKLEAISIKAAKLTPGQAACAWANLVAGLQNLSGPFYYTTPKFNDLIDAIVRASVKAKTHHNQLQ